MTHLLAYRLNSTECVLPFVGSMEWQIAGIYETITNESWCPSLHITVGSAQCFIITKIMLSPVQYMGSLNAPYVLLEIQRMQQHKLKQFISLPLQQRFQFFSTSLTSFSFFI